MANIVALLGFAPLSFPLATKRAKDSTLVPLYGLGYLNNAVLGPFFLAFLSSYTTMSSHEIFIYVSQIVFGYAIEWKLTVNGGGKAEDTEEDIILTPERFWETTLKGKLESVVQQKTPPGVSYQAQDTKVIVSAIGKRKVRKRFDELKIDWKVLKTQSHGWSYLPRLGKQLCITISINYIKASSLAGMIYFLALTIYSNCVKHEENKR
ncbi:hypothetical protein BKA67DRAFT_664625 [Truncatella angustata]|uniref:Uncharacterized protein n=1 Tax=Truncatella angustata TaxID=152316 RepID=A0A9P8RLZ7_9PEZI|nr:uncharacterized protein BKA67DRAFT_664625 [Truncatella angustata]KAH6645566.1 hypothetical protein BKA67DRAFT_664625 [Truncatella angustata]